MIRSAAAAAVLAAASSLCLDARAGDPVLAESLFQQGRALMERGDYVAACPRIAESFAQDPSTGTLLGLALCQEHAGQTASAWATFAEVASRSKRDGRADREAAAREHMTALEPKLSRLTIQIAAPVAALPGLVVTRDGNPVGRGAWGVASPADPGDHVVAAAATGKQTWKTTITVKADADAQTVEVPALEDAPATAPPVVPIATPPSEEPPPAEHSGGLPLRTIGLAVGGAGIVALGVSGFFGLRAASLNDDSKQSGHCDAANRCNDAGYDKRKDAGSAADVASVLLVTGGVLTAAGVTLFFVGGPKHEHAARVEAAPAVGPGIAALSVRGQW